MLKELIKMANHLDQKGLRKEADELDRIIKRYAEDKNYKKGSLYTPQAVKEMFPEGNKNPLTPKPFRTFSEHWEHFWKDSGEDMPIGKYMEISKSMNPDLEDLNSIDDGKVYSAPIPYFVE